MNAIIKVPLEKSNSLLWIKAAYTLSKFRNIKINIMHAIFSLQSLLRKDMPLYFLKASDLRKAYDIYLHIRGDER